jgi:HSP20 family protein
VVGTSIDLHEVNSIKKTFKTKNKMIVTRRRPRRRHHFPIWTNFLNDGGNTSERNGVNINERYSKPAVNVRVYDEHYLIELAAPGYTRDDIAINVEKDQLIISSQRAGTEELKFRMREFNYGSFTRKFQLPEDIDASGITASYNAGILSIHIPKAEEVKPKRIDIK